jgi:hypothetical protein
MKNVSTAWAFTGSPNLRLSNVEDHACREPHKKAMDLTCKPVILPRQEQNSKSHTSLQKKNLRCKSIPNF